ncbi:MAG: PAS domain S-box protein [Dehalococcoidia bacterium]|nr:PAS domain S-box protein [Dehalococcoidia bacterium]
MHPVTGLLTVLDTVLLVRTAPCEFEVRFTPPVWFGAIFGPSMQSQPFIADDGTSFLGNFLVDAEAHWGRGESRALWSGPWTEETVGGDVVLEAGAATVDGECLLVIRRLGETSGDLQEVLQTAREQSLRFEDLFRSDEERKKYQRYLEAEIQKRTRELEDTVRQLRQTVFDLNVAKAEADRQREYFRSLFQNTPEAVVLLDGKGLVVDFNSAFEELFGLSLEVAEGRSIDDLIVPPNKREEARQLTEESHGNRVVKVQDTVRRRQDGTLVPVSIVGAPVVIGDVGIGVLSTYRDNTEQKRAHQRLQDAFIDVVETVSRAMEMSDPYTGGHQRRVAKMASRVGEVLGCDESWLEGIYIGGLLHDIGKISVPSSILVKPGQLREEEWLVLKSHTILGFEILSGASLPWRVDLMARHHHEKLDGSGYPDGLKGDQVNLESRVLAVCDIVEAMSTHRPYRPARPVASIIEELRSGRGTAYDEAVVDAMLSLIEAGEFPFPVEPIPE